MSPSMACGHAFYFARSLSPACTQRAADRLCERRLASLPSKEGRVPVNGLERRRTMASALSIVGGQMLFFRASLAPCGVRGRKEEVAARIEV